MNAFSQGCGCSEKGRIPEVWTFTGGLPEWMGKGYEVEHSKEIRKQWIEAVRPSKWGHPIPVHLSVTGSSTFSE